MQVLFIWSVAKRPSRNTTLSWKTDNACVCFKAIGYHDHSGRYDCASHSFHPCRTLCSLKCVPYKIGWFYYVQSHGNPFAILHFPKYVMVLG